MECVWNLAAIKIFFTGLLLVSSCNNNSDSEYIEENEMAVLLEEIYLLENHYQIQYGSPATYKPYLDSSGMMVLKNHNISKEFFDKSFDYYSTHPSKMIAIQQSIIRSLNHRKESLNQ